MHVCMHVYMHVCMYMRVCTCIILRAHARITMSFDDGDMHTCIRTGEHIFICSRISMSLLIIAFCF